MMLLTLFVLLIRQEGGSATKGFSFFFFGQAAHCLRVKNVLGMLEVEGDFFFFFFLQNAMKGELTL